MPMILNQRWFREWLGVIRKQAKSWANIDPDPHHNMLSLEHSELMSIINPVNIPSYSCKTSILLLQIVVFHYN